jgi:hypothetical protein
MARRASSLGLLSLALLAAPACHSVDLGSPPADVNACRPSQAYFATNIAPDVLFKDYAGGKHCYDSACHGDASNNSLKLTLPAMPTAYAADGGTAPPNPLPMTDWMPDYLATAQQMNCTNETASKLYRLPTGLQTHGGGMLFPSNGPEATEILMWVSQP